MIFRKHRIVVISLLLVFLMLLQGVGSVSAAEKKDIIVVFRYDDFSSLSATSLEVKLLAALKRHKIPCTFGVVPFMCAGDPKDPSPQKLVPLTKTKAKVISKAIKNGDIEIALHGFSHQTIRRVDGGGTEFSGLDYNEQLKRVARGKSSLEKLFGVRIHTFIPPWNRYDSNTILALEKLGLKCISADAYHNADTSKARQFKYLPLTCNLLNLQKAVESARRSPDAQPIIVVMFHPYNFLEVNKERGELTYEDFSNLLSWVASQKDVQTLSIKEATLRVDDLSVHRYNRFASYCKLYALLPPYLRTTTNSTLDDVYLSPNETRKLEIRYWIFISTFYLLILALSATVAFIWGRTIFPRIRFMEPISKFGLPSLTILVSIYALDDLAINYKGITALSILYGACIGVWISLSYVERIHGSEPAGLNQ